MVSFPDEEPSPESMAVESQKRAGFQVLQARQGRLQKGHEEGEASRRACWKGGRGYCGIQRVRREQQGVASSRASGPGFWNGYPLAGMPQEALPPPGCSGLHSYTVKALILGTSGSIDVLMRGKALYIKRPEICKGQHRWSKHSSITECWVQCLEKIKDTLRDEKNTIPNLE